MNLFDGVCGRILLTPEVTTDDIKQEFSGVGMRRDWIANTIEVAFDIRDGAVVTCFSFGEEKEFVEELEGRG